MCSSSHTIMTQEVDFQPNRSNEAIIDALRHENMYLRVGFAAVTLLYVVTVVAFMVRL